MFILGCKSNLRINYKKDLAYLQDTTDYLSDDYIEKLKDSSDFINIDSIRAKTSDFYDIEVCSRPMKRVFNLKDKKLFSIQITNYGSKELYLPEWFRIIGDFDDAEIKIEIYKKEKQKFKKYIQKQQTTETFIQPIVNASNRIVLEINKGKNVTYKNLRIDLYKKIVDKGSYKAKIYIDLSNFGYFKILETEISFEVKE